MRKEWLVTCGALLTVLFSLAPFFYMVLTGVAHDPDFLRPGKPFLFTWQHLYTVLTAESLHFISFVRNSLVVSSLTVLLALFIASLAAYAATRLALRGKNFILFTVLAVSMFPQVSLVSYLYKLMAALGWINTYQALVLPYTAWSLPLAVWILVSYFMQLPRDLDRAGLIDGCSRFQILMKILLPVAAPGIFSTALLLFIFAFNEFLFALMLTTDYSARTIPVGIALFVGMYGRVPWGEIMAAATLATLPLAVLALVFQRRIVQGLTRGAIKE